MHPEMKNRALHGFSMSDPCCPLDNWYVCDEFVLHKIIRTLRQYFNIAATIVHEDQRAFGKMKKKVQLMHSYGSFSTIFAKGMLKGFDKVIVTALSQREQFLIPPPSVPQRRIGCHYGGICLDRRSRGGAGGYRIIEASIECLFRADLSPRYLAGSHVPCTVTGLLGTAEHLAASASAPLERL